MSSSAISPLEAVRRTQSTGPLILLVCLGGSAGCGGETTQSFEIEETDEGDVVALRWHYGSLSLDVDLEISTTIDPSTGACSSSGRLGVDKISDFADLHRIEAIDCEALRVTEDGDIVLDDEPTGYDWLSEELRIDRDNERLFLGPAPVTGTAPGADVATVEFIAYVQGCPIGDCDCIFVERDTDGVVHSVVLPIDCDDAGEDDPVERH